MKTFIFGNDIRERRFNTTYEAMCEYLDANNQYEDVFYAKDDKGEVVNLLEAEALVKSVSPVKYGPGVWVAYLNSYLSITGRTDPPKYLAVSPELIPELSKCILREA